MERMRNFMEKSKQEDNIKSLEVNIEQNKRSFKTKCIATFQFSIL